MKLFRSKSNGNAVIVLKHVASVYPYEMCAYPLDRDDYPSIHVTVIGETTSLLYENEEVRDQDYNDLIKALEKL